MQITSSVFQFPLIDHSKKIIFRKKIVNISFVQTFQSQLNFFAI